MPRAETKPEKNIQLPQSINGATEEKASGQSEATRARDGFCAEAIQKMTDYRRENRIDGEHHGKNPRGGAPAPAEVIEQSNIENTEGRMKSAGKSENNESESGDQPGSRRETHDGKNPF